MTFGSTNYHSSSPGINLRLGLFNMENLFLLFDHEIPAHYAKMNEVEWQKLSSSVFEIINCGTPSKISNTLFESNVFKNSSVPFPNKNSDVLIAVSKASLEWVLMVISSANAFCKILKCGAAS